MNGMGCGRRRRGYLGSTFKPEQKHLLEEMVRIFSDPTLTTVFLISQFSRAVLPCAHRAQITSVLYNKIAHVFTIPIRTVVTAFAKIYPFRYSNDTHI